MKRFWDEALSGGVIVSFQIEILGISGEGIDGMLRRTKPK